MNSASVQAASLSRREFLSYLWGASLALLLTESGGALVWFALPRFKAGDFGGTFTVPIEKVPRPGDPPAEFSAGRFWLVHLDERAVADPRHPPGFASQPGLVVLYKVCVHLGCLYQWKPTSDRFECPCHGSKFLKDGTRVHKPATRDLDRLVVRIVNVEGSLLAETTRGDADDNPAAGRPIAIPRGAAAIQVDTGQRIQGRRNSGPNTVSG